MTLFKCAVAVCILAACAIGAGSVFAAQPLTPAQTIIAQNLVYQDFSTYLGGGKAELSEEFSHVSPLEVSDQDIAQQYLRNAVAADLSYKDKVAVVSATFVSVENWIGDVYRVQLLGVVAEVPKQDAGFLASAHQGQQIELACVMEGKEMDFVHMGSCMSADEFKHVIANEFVSNYLPRLAGTSKPAKTLIVMVQAADALLPSDSACRQPAPSDQCLSDFSALATDPSFQSKLAEIVKKQRPTSSTGHRQ
jgi:hypothetical protein